MIPEWQMEAYERLRTEVVRSAVQDYKHALRKSAKEGRKCDKEKALERFFLSGWGQLLSGDNGEVIIEKCREDFAYVPHPRSNKKMSEETEILICEEYHKGMTIRAVAKKYGVCQETAARCIKKWT